LGKPKNNKKKLSCGCHLRKMETDTYGKHKRKKRADRDFIFGLGVAKLKREKTPIRTEILYLD
jgi:hypothetical protein